MVSHDEKLKNLARRKKIIDLYELDNSKKNFKIEIANVIFRPIFNKNENTFLSIAKINAVFGN